MRVYVSNFSKTEKSVFVNGIKYDKVDTKFIPKIVSIRVDIEEWNKMPFKAFLCPLTIVFDWDKGTKRWKITEAQNGKKDKDRS